MMLACIYLWLGTRAESTYPAVRRSTHVSISEWPMVRPFCAGDDAHMHRLLARQLPEQRARSRNLVGPNSTQRRAESCAFRRSSLTVRACVRARARAYACARACVRACGFGGVVAVAAASTERGACKGTSSSRPRTCRRYPNQASNHRPSLAAASRQLLQRPFQPQTGALRGGSTLGATQVGQSDAARLA